MQHSFLQYTIRSHWFGMSFGIRCIIASYASEFYFGLIVVYSSIFFLLFQYVTFCE